MIAQKELPVILHDHKRGLLIIEKNIFRVLQLSNDGHPPKNLLTCILRNFLKAEIAPVSQASERRLDLHCLGGDDSSHLKLVKFHVLVEAINIQDAEQWAKDIMASAYGSIKPFRRALVLVNPVGGKGKGKAIVQDTVLPILKAAGCIMEVRETTHRSHAEEIAHTMDLIYDVIVPASGDGLVYEVLNGLASRPDAQKALKIPIAPIPTGSANALCINLFGVKDTFNIALACLNVIKGQHLPIDLCSVLLLPSNTRRFSFLATAVGLMVDLDIGTEYLRWMGDVRFLVGFLRGIVTNKSARCKLRLKVVEDDKPDMARKARESVKGQRGRMVGGESVDPLTDGVKGLTIVGNDVGSGLPSKGGRHSPTPHSNGNGQLKEKGAAFNQSTPDHGPIPESKPLVPDDSWITIESPSSKPVPKLQRSSLSSLKVSKNRSVQKNAWVDGQGILYFYAGMMPWIARDLNQWPVSIPGDGLIDVVVQKVVPRTQMASAISGAEKGESFWLDGQHYYKCSALIGENLDKVGQPIFTLDGEAYPFDSFHIEVLPRVANLLSLTGGFYTPEFLEKTDLPRT